MGTLFKFKVDTRNSTDVDLMSLSSNCNKIHSRVLHFPLSNLFQLNAAFQRVQQRCSAWVFFCKFAVYFLSSFSYEQLWRTASTYKNQALTWNEFTVFVDKMRGEKLIVLSGKFIYFKLLNSHFNTFIIFFIIFLSSKLLVIFHLT